MSEQAPTGDLGGVQPHFGFPREYIEVCVAEDGEFSFGLASVDTRGDSGERYEADKGVLTEKLDSVLRLYGHEPAAWTQLAEGLVVVGRYGYPETVSGARIRTRGIDVPLGEYVRDRAFWAMPMESELDGSGRVELTLKLSDEYHLRIVGTGVYGRERFYKEPEEPRPEQPYMKDVNFDPIDDPDDPDYLGFRDWHRITFTGHIIPAPQPAQQPQAA